MLDRHGWPLEIGDRVTIGGPCVNAHCLHGRHALVLEVRTDYVDVSVLSVESSSGEPLIASVPGEVLEYGHVGIEPVETPGFDARNWPEQSMVVRVAATAVEQGLITQEQAAKIIDFWSTSMAENARR